jgi:uncharacterized protein with HEPN domain
MQQHDVATLLSHARKAATLIQGFVAERTWDDYRGDELVRSAVERQFQIVGEAFRNILVPGYSVVDDDIVWETATSRIKPLIVALDQRLREVKE